MKKTFVMAAAIIFSIATIAQPGTRQKTKNRKQPDSTQLMGKDSLYMSSDSDSTSNGRYRSNKKNKMNKANKANKMKSRSRMAKDSIPGT